MDAFRVPASDIGLITKVFVEMYNTGQSKKWFLEKVSLARLFTPIILNIIGVSQVNFNGHTLAFHPCTSL